MKPLTNWMMNIGIGLFVLYGVVHAETMYVTDVLKLTLRTGESTEHKIIAVIESGQEVEMLQSGDEWSKVRLSDGKEGWVLTRYLTPSVTHNIKLEKLEIKHEDLLAKVASLTEENDRLKSENKQVGASAASNEKDLDELRSDYETLKAESAEFLSLKSEYKTASAQLAEKTQKAARLEEQVLKLERSNYIKWFLAGSGVLLVGFLIGFSAKRQRRRSSLL